MPGPSHKPSRSYGRGFSSAMCGSRLSTTGRSSSASSFVPMNPDRPRDECPHARPSLPRQLAGTGEPYRHRFVFAALKPPSVTR